MNLKKKLKKKCFLNPDSRKFDITQSDEESRVRKRKARATDNMTSHKMLGKDLNDVTGFYNLKIPSNK